MHTQPTAARHVIVDRVPLRVRGEMRLGLGAAGEPCLFIARAPPCPGRCEHLQLQATRAGRARSGARSWAAGGRSRRGTFASASRQAVRFPPLLPAPLGGRGPPARPVLPFLVHSTFHLVRPSGLPFIGLLGHIPAKRPCPRPRSAGLTGPLKFAAEHLRLPLHLTSAAREQPWARRHIRLRSPRTFKPLGEAAP